MPGYPLLGRLQGLLVPAHVAQEDALGGVAVGGVRAGGGVVPQGPQGVETAVPQPLALDRLQRVQHLGEVGHKEAHRLLPRLVQQGLAAQPALRHIHVGQVPGLDGGPGKVLQGLGHPPLVHQD